MATALLASRGMAESSATIRDANLDDRTMPAPSASTRSATRLRAQPIGATLRAYGQTPPSRGRAKLDFRAAAILASSARRPLGSWLFWAGWIAVGAASGLLW